MGMAIRWLTGAAMGMELLRVVVVVVVGQGGPRLVTCSLSCTDSAVITYRIISRVLDPI